MTSFYGVKITTFAKLKKVMQQWLLLTADPVKVTTDADVLRFVAAQKVSETADFSTRDMVTLFVDGIRPMSKRAVKDWLEIAEECAEDFDTVEEGRPNWDALLEDFYGAQVG